MSDTKLHYVKCKHCGNYKAISADMVKRLNEISGAKNFVCYACKSENERVKNGFRDIRRN